MTITTCDFCGARILFSVIRFEVADGCSPQNGNPLARLVESCPRCTSKIPNLTTSAEFNEMRRALASGEANESEGAD